jgi:hypothetical protein
MRSLTIKESSLNLKPNTSYTNKISFFLGMQNKDTSTHGSQKLLQNNWFWRGGIELDGVEIVH